MKITVKPMEFDIFKLFCHEWPYGLIVSESELRDQLNRELQELYLHDYQILEFLTTDDCGLDRWKIHIVKQDEKPTRLSTYYPKDRVYTVSQVKKGIPATIRRALHKLDKLKLVFNQEDD